MSFQFESPSDGFLLSQLVDCGVPDLAGYVETKSPYNKFDYQQGAGTLQLGRINPDFEYPVLAVIRHKRGALLKASFILGLRAQCLEIFSNDDLRLEPTVPIGNITMEMTNEHVGLSFRANLGATDFVDVPGLDCGVAIKAAESVLMFTQRGLIKSHSRPESFNGIGDSATLGANV